MGVEFCTVINVYICAGHSEWKRNASPTTEASQAIYRPVFCFPKKKVGRSVPGGVCVIP